MLSIRTHALGQLMTTCAGVLQSCEPDRVLAGAVTGPWYTFKTLQRPCQMHYKGGQYFVSLTWLYLWAYRQIASGKVHMILLLLPALHHSTHQEHQDLPPLH